MEVEDVKSTLRKISIKKEKGLVRDLDCVNVTRVDRLTSRSRITYSEGGTHEETLHPQSKAKVMNKR